jgi:acid phosphatase family membrane protein YuiD
MEAAHAVELRKQAEESARQLQQLQQDMTREKEEEIDRLKAILTDRCVLD